MKEIRHYIKRIADFPRSMLYLETLSPEALWNDTLIFQSKNLSLKKEIKYHNWLEVKNDPNLLGLHGLICYLLCDISLQGLNLNLDELVRFLKERLPTLSNCVQPYTEWTSDSERSEELVRALFSYLKIIPEGESEKYSVDRLRSIDTIERIRILEESKKAQERAKEILRKIKEAEDEAASKYNRE